MAQETVRDMPAGLGWPAFALAVGVGAVGVIMMHYPMIVSGLARVQTDVGDSRLINYFLEHNYRWFRGDHNHARIWNPPFFYPARNIAAHSDTMTVTTPVYGAFRAAGLAPDTSFQLWMMAMSVGNYVVAFHLLRRRLRMSVPAASAGAFLFAFGNPRVCQLGHQQLMPQFLGLIAVDAVFGLFPGCGTPMWRRVLLWPVAAAGVIAQLTTGVYLGWFLIFSLGIALVVAVWLPSTRRPCLDVLRRDAPWIAMSALLGGLAIRNWLSHEVAAAAELGSRYYLFATYCLPRPLTWLYISPDSWLEGWSTQLIGRPGHGIEHWEPCGVGLVTTLTALGGLILARDRPSVRLLVTVAFAVFLSVTVLPVGPLFGMELVLIQGSVAVAHHRRRNDPAAFLGVVGLVLVAVNLSRVIKLPLQGVGLSTLVIALAAFARWDGNATARLGLGGLTAGLMLSLLPAPFLALGSVVGALLTAAAAVAGWRSRRHIEAGFLGTLLLVSTLMTYGYRPTVFLIAASALPALAATRLAPTRFRPSAWHLLSAAGFGLGLMVVFNEVGLAWQLIYINMPGAKALLFMSRVGLLMLIPWAIGLGFCLDGLIARRRPLLALSLGVICLAEQGVSTRSFDKAQNREIVSSLAKRIDKGADAFYFSPRNSRYPSWKANLDAMWAGLESGVPTINGYSGSTPIGWRPLEDSNVRAKADLDSLQNALRDWRKNYGQTVGRIWWVGGPSDGWLDGIPKPGRQH